MGRGLGHRFLTQPVRLSSEAGRHQFTDPVAEWWATLAHLLTAAAIHRSRGHPAEAHHVQVLAKHLEGVAAGCPRGAAAYLRPECCEPSLEALILATKDVDAVPPDTLTDLSEVAKKAASRAAQAARSRSLNSFKAWVVEAAVSKPAALHAAVKDKSSSGLVAPGLLHPLHILDAKADTWSRVWDDPRADQGLILDELRSAALGTYSDGLVPIGGDDVEAAVSAMKKRTGLGIDMLSPTDIERLPPLGKQAVAMHFDLVETQLSWAWQMLMVRCAAIGKKPGGERLIGILAMLQRVWSKCREPVAKEWSFAINPFWDAAVAGNSPLREALERALCDEVVAHIGGHSISGYLDVKQFYDNISIPKSIRAATRLGFPVTILILELQMNMAPRFISSGKAVSKPIYPVRSTIAGGRNSGRFARCLLHALLHRVTSAHPAVCSRTWVDDLAQRVEGHRISNITRIQEAMRETCEGLTDLGLVVSPKSQVTATDFTDAKTVSAYLRRHGWDVKPARMVADLGIGMGGGRRRATEYRVKRIKKTAGRHRRIRIFARISKAYHATRTLATVGALPADTYGYQVLGLPPAARCLLRRRLGWAVSSEAKSRCLMTLLAMRAPVTRTSLSVSRKGGSLYGITGLGSSRGFGVLGRPWLASSVISNRRPGGGQYVVVWEP